MKKLRLKKSDVGNLCLVRWDDIGRVESLIVEVDDDRKRCDVFCFADDTLSHGVGLDQIVEISGRCFPNKC